MEIAGLSPGFKFEPSDEDLVLHYLLPRLHGKRLPLDGAIIDDDPRSAAPWQLLARHGRSDEAFFFAPVQAKCRKGNRQERRCAGGGTWQGQKRVDESRQHEGEVIGWRKYVLNFHVDGGKGSAGWVMHELTITNPAHPELMLCRVKLSVQGKNRKRTQENVDSEGTSRGAPRLAVMEPPPTAWGPSPQILKGSPAAAAAAMVTAQVTADVAAACGAMPVPEESLWPSAAPLYASDQVHVDDNGPSHPEPIMPLQPCEEQQMQDWPRLLDAPESFAVREAHNITEWRTTLAPSAPQDSTVAMPAQPSADDQPLEEPLSLMDFPESFDMPELYDIPACSTTPEPSPQDSTVAMPAQAQPSADDQPLAYQLSLMDFPESFDLPELYDIPACSTTPGPSHQESVVAVPAQSSADEPVVDQLGLMDFPESFPAPELYDMAACSTNLAPSHQDYVVPVPAQSSADEPVVDQPGLMDFPESFDVPDPCDMLPSADAPREDRLDLMDFPENSPLPDPFDMPGCSNDNAMIDGEIGNYDFTFASGDLFS